MNKTYTTEVETEEVCFVKLPEELGFKPGDKFTIEQTEEGFILKPYVNIEVDIPDELFLELAKLAHEQDVTFNELCNKIIKEKLKDSID